MASASDPAHRPPALEVAGRLFAAGAAAHVPAVLRLAPDGGLWLAVEGVAAQPLPRQPLRWSDRIGNAPQRATLADGRSFETMDHAGLRQLRRRAGGGDGAWLHGLERAGLVRLLGLTLLTFACLAAGLRWGLPAVADLAARHVPASIEHSLGAGSLRTLDATAFSPTEAPEAARLSSQAAFAALKRHMPADAPDAVLHFRRSPALGPNAYALPGGIVVLSDELIAMASDDEIAGVLAHELGHVAHRHGLRRLARATGLSMALMLITGDPSSLLSDTAAMGAVALDLSYSRDFEREADRHAIALLRADGRDPAALAALLQRLTKAAGDDAPLSQWLASHPPTPERMRMLRGDAAAPAP